jgi:hypothetical protein
MKALSDHLPLDEDFLGDVLSEMTFSVGERIFLRDLENEDNTVMRNIVL